MSSDALIGALKDLAHINPRRRIVKGVATPFIEMAALPLSGRDVDPGLIQHRRAKGTGAHFQDGDTLLARITPCLENGKTAQVRGLGSHVVGEGSTEFIVLCGLDPADNDFVYYLCRDPAFRQFAIARMEGTSGRQRVVWQSIAGYPFKSPSVIDRHRAAELLSLLDDRIDNLRATNATLEAIAQALFKSWFVDFDPVHAKAEGHAPAGMDAATAALFPSEFEGSELGPIPKGWQVKSLDAIADYLNGLALQKYPPESDDEFLPVIKIAQLHAGNTRGADRASAHLKPGYVVHDGDVLFSWSGSLEVEVWCGGSGALNQHLFRVTSDKVPKWYYYFATRQYLRHFRGIAANKATTMGHIQRRHLAEAKMAVPSGDVLPVLSKFIEPLFDDRVNNALRVRSLEDLRDSLLPRLISGKLRLPDARELAETDA